jgi:putative transposase
MILIQMADLAPCFRLYYGPEFTGKAMLLWSQKRRVQLHFIQPGKPTQNAFVESFNGKFRDQCLNLNWFPDLAEARRAIDEWPSTLQRSPPT